MSDTVPSGSIPENLNDYGLPFHYGTFTNIGVDYLVAPDKARALLSTAATKERLSAVVFGTDPATYKACVSFNYQLYFAQFAQVAGITQEIELNVVAFPTAEASRTPQLSYKEYAAGLDQSRRTGFSRINVLCDSDMAIAAGKALFNEPKTKAAFAYTLPVPNATAGGPEAADRWKVSSGKTGATPNGGEFAPDDRYFTFTADLHGLRGLPVSSAPFTEYGTRKHGTPPADKPLAAPLNVFSPYSWYDLDGKSGLVKLSPGTEGTQQTPKPYDLVKPFISVIKDLQPAGAWVYQSPPVAMQNRPYWVTTN